MAYGSFAYGSAPYGGAQRAVEVTIQVRSGLPSVILIAAAPRAVLGSVPGNPVSLLTARQPATLCTVTRPGRLGTRQKQAVL